MTGKKGMHKDRDFKVTKAFFEAGQKNLEEWKEAHPEGGAITHGAFSSSVRKRYSDRRTVEGRHLQNIVENIKEDLGRDLDQRQCILLDRIKEKLIVLLQIGDYLDKQSSVIKDDELLACLGKNYISFDNSLTRSLTLLYEAAGKKQYKVPSLDDWIDTQDQEKDIDK